MRSNTSASLLGFLRRLAANDPRLLSPPCPLLRQRFTATIFRFPKSMTFVINFSGARWLEEKGVIKFLAVTPPSASAKKFAIGRDSLASQAQTVPPEPQRQTRPTRSTRQIPVHGTPEKN
jgi:hypothetical protein